MSINDPRDITGLRVWYSAEYEATQYANGVKVTTLHDLSGNGHHASGEGASGPVINYTGGPGGGARFVGANSQRFAVPLAAATGLTVAEALTVVTPAATNNGLWTFSTANNVAHFGYGSVPRQVYDNFFSNIRKDAGGFTVVAGTWYRYRVRSKAGGWTNWLDNVQKYNTATNTFNLTQATDYSLLASGSGNPYYLGGMSLFVLYDHELTAGERTDLEAWAVANPSGGLPFSLDPPDDPTGLAVDPHIFTADFTWDASTGSPDGYEVRLDGGSGTDVATDLDYPYTGLTPETTYTAGVRAYNAGGFSNWVDLEFTTLAVPPATTVVNVGETPTDVYGGCTLINVRRGLTPDGVTEKLEPGVATVVLKGDAYNPLTNEDLRPGRPIQIALHVTDVVPYDVPIFTGTIKRAAVAIDKTTGTMFTTLTALDAVPVLSATPYIVAHKGNLTQRLTPVLDAAATVAYVITDSAPALVAGSLPTDKRTVLEQLLLVRDTMHAIVYVDRENVLQVIADQDRDESAPTVTLTDSDYVGLDLGFDTDDLVNVMTVELLTGELSVVESFDLPDLVSEWGERAQTVTVNDGAPENHALRYMARLPGPALVAKTIRVNGTLEGFEAVAALEIAQAVQVIQGDVLDAEQQIMHLVHTITPRPYRPPKWMTDVVVRQREVRPLRWDDVPPALTWDDLDPAMTWNTAVFWHP